MVDGYLPLASDCKPHAILRLPPFCHADPVTDWEVELGQTYRFRLPHQCKTANHSVPLTKTYIGA